MIPRSEICKQKEMMQLEQVIVVRSWAAKLIETLAFEEQKA
jgi:hypothetical protein